MQDYKSTCEAVTICATLVNTRTHTERDKQTQRQLLTDCMTVFDIFSHIQK